MRRIGDKYNQESGMNRTAKHPMYFQRLSRDINDLLNHDFNCSSSCLSVTKDELNGITVNVCILEGIGPSVTFFHSLGTLLCSIGDNIQRICQEHTTNRGSTSHNVLTYRIPVTYNLLGPYRSGHFSFALDIPVNYPFKEVEVWARHPIWHPNVDLLSGAY